MHHVTHFDPAGLVVPPAYEGHSTGYGRISHIGPAVGAVHASMGTCELAESGAIESHVHSYEEIIYVLRGHPILQIGPDARRLEPGACAFIGIGVEHSWSNPEPEGARWLDLETPSARLAGENPDTFFVGGQAATVAPPVDVRDPRLRPYFLWRDEQADLDRLKQPSPVDSPSVSASMSSALLAYGGIAVKMLIDERHGAHLGNLFMVQYQPEVVLHPHDHPLEEAFYVIEGEVVYIADGEEYTMGPGAVAYAGVSCIHAFENRSGKLVRWVESRAPLPPPAYEYRFNRDWDHLAAKLADGH